MHVGYQIQVYLFICCGNIFGRCDQIALMKCCANSFGEQDLSFRDNNIMEFLPSVGLCTISCYNVHVGYQILVYLSICCGNIFERCDQIALMKCCANSVGSKIFHVRDSKIMEFLPFTAVGLCTISRYNMHV